MKLLTKAQRLKNEIRSFEEFRLFSRVLLLSSILPLLLRLLKLPTLLKLLTPSQNGTANSNQDIDQAVRYTNLVLGNNPLSYRACLARSLILYDVLRRMGLPVQVNFGIKKTAEGLRGHSWLMQGDSVVFEPTEKTDAFSVVYTYPP